MSADKVYQNVTVIVAVAANLAIGRDNTIPWHLRADLQYFKKMTMDKTIIMGRNTFASLGFRKLPGRTSVVVTSDPELGDKYGVETYTSLAAAIAAHRGEPEIMIIGGGRLYREAVNYAARLLVTKVDTVVEDAQVFFPSFEDAFRLVGREDF
ncbi:MAG: dihydrofolate reductase, partial [Succinivibrionaceae bacterium]|nr:dihydrofolate reductase [Succinivibrionaceae bacterium]